MPTTITPVDVTPAFSAAQYDTVDLTSHVGTDAGSVVGAILRVVNTNVSGTETGFDLRKPGSTDDFSANNIEDDAQVWAFVGVDSNDTFEVYRGADDYELWLVAYVTSDEGASFTNAIDKTPGTEDAFTDVDVSGDTGADTAVLAFFRVVNTGTAGTRNIGYRENGSADSLFGQHFSNENAWFAVGLDGSEICEIAVNNSGAVYDDSIYLIGYLTANVTWQTNASDHSQDTTGSYQSTDLSGTIPSGNDGAMVILPEAGAGIGQTSQPEADADVRRTGSTIDRSGKVYDPRGVWAFVPLDAGRTMEQFISATDMDLKLLGWTQAPAGTATGFVNRSITAVVG